jgi:hypothetical protein
MEYPAKSAFSAFRPCDAVLLRRELRPPLFISFDDSRRSNHVGEGSFISQEADANFVGLIFHGTWRIVSVGISGSERSDGSYDCRNES